MRAFYKPLLFALCAALAFPAIASIDGGHDRAPAGIVVSHVRVGSALLVADAGTDGTAVFCSTSPSAPLINSLVGSPDLGGSWTGPNGAHSGTFVPGTDPAGVYTYTVVEAPDPPVSATVTVTVHDPPTAGGNGTHTVCVNGAAFQLIDDLVGTVTPGGIWTGPGATAVPGTFTPGTSVPGIYTYTVNGTPPCGSASATVTVTVNSLPNAGGNGTHTVCSNGAPFDLFVHLTGTPQNTGAWTGPSSNPVVATYTPGTSVPGVYTYTVPGNAPCVSASATVTVTQVVAPNPGVGRSITVCSDEASFDMRSRLNGTPDAGGSWVGPGGAHGAMFNPATDAAGPYVYTVMGTTPCVDVSATLTITLRQAPHAGTNGSITLCSTDGVYTLFNAIGGGPDVGGTWLDPGGQAHSGSFTPGSSTVGVYTYTVTGQAPCTPSTATVTVAVNQAPNAGVGASVTRCSNSGAFSLFAQLTGSPAMGGTWTGPGGAHGATFTPGTDQPGAYTYTVLGLTPCANATAVVNVAVVRAPVAGTNATITVCGNDPAFNLFALLGGTPDATGSWTAPGGGAATVTFTPGTSPAGAYTYLVPGTAPCVNAQATVTVTVVAPPNPGTNGSITVCSSEGSVDLFAQLGGGPSMGGTWTKPDGTAHNGTYLPGTQPGGNYTYTVAGTTPCSARSAVVQVVRVIAPNAGTNGTITVCSTNGPFPLISVLGGSPNGTGTWFGPANTIVSATFDPAASPQGLYKYVVPGTAPCVNDTGFVTVTVRQAPNAGQNGSALVCSSATQFDLVDSLEGTPDGGGTWVGPGGSNNGTFIPGTSTQGGYTYTVPGQTPCLAASAVVVVNVNRQPVAGTSVTITRCSTDGPVDLFMECGGTPDAGGTWTGPGGVSSGIFIPGTSQPGAYVYTVMGTAPCSNATSTITVIVNQAPNAGTNGTLTICQGTASVDLLTGLGGTPDMTGTWTEVNTTGQLSGNFFNPGALPPGNYDFLYTVAGIGQCGNDDATVRVTIVPTLEAGSNGTLAACRTNTQVNLFNGLGGGPQPGGQWIDLNGVGLALNGQFLNATMVAAGTYQFRYRLSGIAGCDSDSSMVTVTVVAAPNAGTNGSTITCSNSPNFQLFPLLGGNPTPGGLWHVGSVNGPAFSGTYNPQTNSPNTFFYVVNGSAPCSSASSSVTVQEVPEPNAGLDAPRTVCSNSDAFNMTAALGGDPDPSGTWFFNNQNHGVLFVPGLDVQGIYEYRVPGVFPCAQKIAFLNVTVRQEAFAGLNSSTNVCSEDGPFLLFDALGGSPNNGGTWLNGSLQPTSGTFTPGTTTPGDFYYKVSGTAPCINDTALVSVFVDPSPNAGDPGAGSFCANQAVVNLITLLGSTPDPFGTWVGPAPTNPPFSGQFNPAVSAPGLYTYTVTNSCGSDVSTANVQVSQPANAGCPASITVCSSDPAFAMVDRLGCSPSLIGGGWVGPLPSTAAVNGVFTPGTSSPGTYRYTVQGTGACPNTSATLTIEVNPARNAGNDASVSLCRTDALHPLPPHLGPSAQAGGSWFFGGLPHTPSILPSVDVTGTYTYVVYGAAPCQNDTARVFVQISTPAYAGIDGLSQVCSSDAPFQLITYLTGGPAFNGNWFDPFGAPSTGIFTPGTDQGGAYKYRVPGNGGCPADSSFVTVIQSEAVDAGDPGGQVLVCSNAPSFQLFQHLNGTPQLGGDWYDPDGVAFTGTYFPGLSQPGVYKYKRIGTTPCPSDSATVTVFQSEAPNAGISTLAEVCSSQGQVSMLDLLGGAPDNNGTWTFNGDDHGPFFDPASDLAGAYVYTVVGQAPCPTATAQVTISLIQAPRAGTNGSIPACAGSSSVDLFAALGGGPTTGGTWSTNCSQGTLTNGVFDATGMVAGASCVFTYTHVPVGPCPSVSAQVTVTVVDALDAGQDSSIQACSGQLVDLFAALAGSPQEGGIWRNIDNAPGLIGAAFNTSAVPSGTTWRFDHILPGSGGCQADTAEVTVEVLDGPYAGCDGSASVCSSFPPVTLAGSLGCGPDGDGFWLDPTLAPHNGVFVPATDPVGMYRYVVEGFGTCPADTAVVTVTLTNAPNAGADADLVICSSDAPVNMFTLLGPTAQVGGFWTIGSITPHTNIYNPAIDVPALYIYHVAGQFPCGMDQASVNVTEPQAPNAGCPASVTFCSSQGPQLMRNFLGCSPMPTGTWTFVDGDDEVPHGDLFDPAVDAPGVYRYTVVGETPCANATAELTIGLVPAGNAGSNATRQACASQTELDLFLALGVEAQTGGFWTDINTSGALTGNLFNPSIAGNGTWNFRYTIPAAPPCAAVFALVTVTVGSGANAGSDSTLTICGAAADYQLFNALGGNPDAGGTWTDLAGTGALLPNGILNASLLPVGGQSAFVYTLEDAGCGNVSATVLITTTAYPDPGVATPLVLCSTGDPVDLFEQLAGTPQSGGIWTGPQGANNGTFDPAMNTPGPYTYMVAGNAACSDSTAVIQVTVNQPPDAGGNAQIMVCDTLTAFPLISGLLGSPQSGGTWTEADGTAIEAYLNTTLLTPDEYEYHYLVMAAGCADDVAILKIDVVSNPVVADLVTICNEQDRTYVVSFTIEKGDATTYEVLGALGSITLQEPFIFTSDPIVISQPFYGLVRDGYGCREVPVEATSPCDFDTEVFVPESFSPNGDGVNEQFRIPGIEGYPNNSIVIFNRWGAEVFRGVGYDNSAVMWDGTSPDATLSGGAPTGTYFYVLDLGDDSEAITGFIQLIR